MTVWADADSLPAAVRETVAKRAAAEADRGRNLAAVFVANRKIPVALSGAVSFLRAGTEEGAADALILERAAPGDLVVTRDIPLAQALLERAGGAVAVINDRGGTFDADSIRERRSIRDAMARLDAVGLVERPASSYGKREAKAFADAFDRELSRLLKGAGTRSGEGGGPCGTTTD